MSQRRYNEREISALLKRATELQEQQDGSGTHDSHGLSLEEIQQIAHDVGVDPELVAWAAEEMNQPAVQESGVYLWGGPIKPERTRHVRGELTDGVRDTLVKEIRERLGQEGIIESLGDSLTWKSKEKVADVEIKAVPRDGGGTTLHSKQNLWQVAFPLFWLPLFFTLMFGIGIMQEQGFLSPELKVLIVGALLVAEFLAIRAGFGFWNRKKQREMDTLMKRLDAVLLETTTALDTSTVSPGIDLPEDQEAESEMAQRRRSATL